MGYDELASVVVSWMKILQPWVFSVDRTTWEFGEECHNILTLGIVHQGNALSVGQLEALGEALLDFQERSDLSQGLEQL
jgi:hypothetical protein